MWASDSQCQCTSFFEKYVFMDLSNWCTGVTASPGTITFILYKIIQVMHTHFMSEEM